jgi:hypothetical protein
MLTVFHLVLMLLFNSISHLLSYAAFGSDEALCCNTYTVKPALKVLGLGLWCLTPLQTHNYHLNHDDPLS